MATHTTTGVLTGPGALVVGKAVQVFKEDFNAALDSGKWFKLESNGTTSFTGGVMSSAFTSNASTSQTHIISEDPIFTLIDHPVFVKIVQAIRLSGDITGALTYFSLLNGTDNDDDDRVTFNIDSNGNLIAVRMTNGVGTNITTITTAYWTSVSTYTWFRFRCNATHLFFDTAAASASNPPIESDWTERASVLISALAWTLTGCRARLGISSSVTGYTLTQTPAKFDGLNTGTSTTHACTGALVGPGAVVAGSAAHYRTHPSTGALVGETALLGFAAHALKHTTSGVLAGPGAILAGQAGIKTTHTTSGVLTAPGALVDGLAFIGNNNHVASGDVVGPGSMLFGIGVFTVELDPAEGRRRNHLTPPHDFSDPPPPFEFEAPPPPP